MTLDAERSLFDDCLAADSAEACERLLSAYPDAAVSARVRRLLLSHDSSPSSLGLEPPEFPRMALPHRIGPFRILDTLGEGAMGEVYLAEQAPPLRRRVALKVLKFGLGTREVLARFELERQSLALMTHPNIARMFDAGTTEDGRPYFAMEYIAGVAITRYCDDRRLGLAERIELFCAACDAVQHAHLRGVIHRDLKPSNILVTEIDGRPVPKVIDFGIAKATTAGADSADAYTRFGSLLGTPEYMSPEQAQLSPLDIDARTDVYSLGVILYELLTGSRPYHITRGSIDPAVLAREVVEGDVTRPSARAVDGAADEIGRAQQRGCQPRALSARLRGDLDWIVFKALEKDRQRRYASPAELAADLVRAGSNEPVTAGPPAFSYRAGKFVRRHRLAVGAIASVFVAALVFGAGMALLARQATRERDRANVQAEVARRVTEFTAGLFEFTDPASSGSSTISARQLLDAGVQRLEASGGAGRRDVTAALYEAAGNAYRGLGQLTAATPLLDRAVTLRQAAAAAAPSEYAAALLSRARLAHAQGEFAHAEQLLQAAQAVLQRADPVDPDTLNRVRLELVAILRLRSRLDEAAAVAALVLRDYESMQPGNQTGVAAASMQLGFVETARGNLAVAERALTRAVELYRQSSGAPSMPLIEAKHGLADVLVTMGKSTQAEPLQREIVEDTRRIYGSTHPEVAVALGSLGNAVSDFPDRLGEAEQIYDEAIELLRHNAAPGHPELAMALNNIGALYLQTRRFEAARRAYAEAVAIRLSVLGAGHPETAAAQMGLANALSGLGRYREAVDLLRTAVRSFANNLGPDHWRTANAERNLGIALIQLGRLDEAEQTLQSAASRLEASLGSTHPRTVSARAALLELAARRSRRRS